MKNVWRAIGLCFSIAGLAVLIVTVFGDKVIKVK